MPNWVGWIVVAVVCFIAEMITPSFFIAWFGVGAVVAAFLALFGMSFGWQIGMFIVVGVVLVVFTKKMSVKWFRPEKMRKTNVEAAVGSRGSVMQAIPEGGFGQVRVGTETWMAAADDGLPIPFGAVVTVVRVDGVHLVVNASDFQSHCD